jgi:hypothetical protein
VSNIDVVPHDRFSESSADVINLKTSFDKTELSTKLIYIGSSQVQLILSDPNTNAQVYDSGILSR